MITRDEIAAALSTVAGVSGHRIRPATPAAGAAWPVWRATRGNAGGAIARADGPRSVSWWIVVAVTDADMADPLLVPVTAALLGIVAADDRSTLRIDAIEPAVDVVNESGATIPLLRWSATN